MKIIKISRFQKSFGGNTSDALPEGSVLVLNHNFSRGVFDCERFPVFEMDSEFTTLKQAFDSSKTLISKILQKSIKNPFLMLNIST